MRMCSDIEILEKVIKRFDMTFSKDKELTTLTRVVILIALYFLGGLLGKQASFLSGSIALVWPPAGIALAAILLFGYRFWPGVALGAVLFSFMNGMPFGFFTFGTALGNTMGAIVCTFLLKRFIAFDNAMERTRDVAGYIGLACFLGTTVNAAFNVVSLVYGGSGVVVRFVPHHSGVVGAQCAGGSGGGPVPHHLGDAVGPPLACHGWWWKRSFAATGLVAGTLISFHSWFVYGIQNYPLAYLPFPFLVWGALRFGQRGATTGTLLVSALAIHSLLQRARAVRGQQRAGEPDARSAATSAFWRSPTCCWRPRRPNAGGPNAPCRKAKSGCARWWKTRRI